MEAFEELYRVTEKSIYGFSLSLTQDHHDALDLVQDVYVKILASAHLYKPMGKPLAWMFTITRNIFYTKTKRNKRSINVELDNLSNDIKLSYIEDFEHQIIIKSALKILKEEER